MGGMYDGADLDEVVVAVICAMCVAERPLSILIKPTMVPAGSALPVEEPSLPAELISGHPIRSPPPFAVRPT